MVKKNGMYVETKPKNNMQPLEIEFDGIYVMVKIGVEIHTTLILTKLFVTTPGGFLGSQFCASCLITLGELK